MKLISALKQFEQIHTLNCAIIYTLMAQLFLCILASLFKGGDLPIYQTLLIRSVFLVILIRWLNPELDYIPKLKFRNLFTVGMLLAFEVIVYYIAYFYLNLNEVIVIYSTTGLWSQLFGVIILKEQFKLFNLIILIFSIIGIIIIANPNFNELLSDGRFMGCVIVLVSSIVCALGYIKQKQLGSDINPNIIVFYVNLCVIFQSSIFQIYNPSSVCNLTQKLPWICMVVIATIFYQNFQYRANSIVSYSQTAVYSYSSIVFSFIFDQVLFNTQIQLNGLIGCGIIILSLIGSLKYGK